MKRLFRYGVDAPLITWGSFVLGIILILLNYRDSWALGIILWLLAIGITMHTLRKYAWVERIIQHCNLQTAAKILDVGTGKGFFMVHVAKAAGHVAFVTGIEDRSQVTIRNARKNARKERVGNRVNVIHGDVRHLPFPGDSFNVVTAMDTKHSFVADQDPKDVKQIYGEIVRVLKQYGTFILVSNQKNVNRIYDQLKSWDDVQVKRSHNSTRWNAFRWGQLVLKKE